MFCCCSMRQESLEALKGSNYSVFIASITEGLTSWKYYERWCISIILADNYYTLHAKTIILKR